MLTASTERLERLPKAELHVHLDGSLRPATMLALASERGVELPVSGAEELARYMCITDARGLEDYLERFRLTLLVMQDREALERIAYELAVDHAAEQVTWLEVRFCPGLNTTQGLSPEAVLDAALAGLTRAAAELPIRAAVIVCGLRSLPAAASREMAELAVSYAGYGVCGFDLAGAEAGHPVGGHADAVLIAAEGGLPVTIHAGEAFGPESIRQALDIGGAVRLGHGTRLREDPALLERVREEGVTLEVCLTSNVQTRVAPSYEAHPLRQYFDAGLSVSLCTDNRLVSGVTLTREYEHARDDLSFSWGELTRIARNGFEKAFVPEELRRKLLSDFDEGLRRLA